MALTLTLPGSLANATGGKRTQGDISEYLPDDSHRRARSVSAIPISGGSRDSRRCIGSRITGPALTVSQHHAAAAPTGWQVVLTAMAIRSKR